jgi:hypothetical protein
MTISNDTNLTNTPELANPAGVAANAIATCISFRSKAESAKQAAKTAVKAAIEIFGNASASKQVREILVKRHGFTKQQVSEAFLEFGLRARAKSVVHGKKDAALQDAILALVARATELAGDDACVALRRAYLSLQAKRNA